LAVRERAKAEGILTFTYAELFRSFEKVHPYLTRILNDGDEARLLTQLEEVYEEPSFSDIHGTPVATEFLNEWLEGRSPKAKWLVVVGEYGTGKTALTRILQRRWARAYKAGTDTPLPFRIELRDFAKQFDSRGLLHHFSGQNELSHLPIDFIESMIANGRVALLLDGYDEMAQYLNIRQRRACLEALSELARGGARGILTSRPNYFTEAEELRVFEVLYQRLTNRAQFEVIDQVVIRQEQNIDVLLERFLLDRGERELRDLTPAQTSALVRRQLHGDLEGATVVLALLDRIYRSEEVGNALSLSGKPVIVSYLIEVVAESKADTDNNGPHHLGEWQIFDLIVTKLMYRDYNRTPELLPSDRLRFLKALAVRLTSAEQRSFSEFQFRELVQAEFPTHLKRKRADGVPDALETLFDDLRSSSTLTRLKQARGGYFWQFSHNSLREFLLVVHLIETHLGGLPGPKHVPLTDPMKIFVQSMPDNLFDSAVERLATIWPVRSDSSGAEQILSLLWSGLRHRRGSNGLRAALTSVVGDGLDLGRCSLSSLNLSGYPAAPAEYVVLSAPSSELMNIDFSYTVLDRADFRGTAFDDCSFQGTRCHGADFRDSLILDCDVTGLDCAKAIFEVSIENPQALYV